MNGFLVIGPESSGTRLVTRLLISAGVYGDDGHVQRLDRDGAIERAPTLPFVVRRSLPHGGGWPDLFSLYDRISGRLAAENAGEPGVVITLRDFDVLALSQVRNHHVRDVETARRHINRAILEIGAFIVAVRPKSWFISYESLVLHPKQVQESLYRWAGVPSGSAPAYIYDGDKKYYEEASSGG